MAIATPISLGLSWLQKTNPPKLGVAIAIHFHYGVGTVKSPGLLHVEIHFQTLSDAGMEVLSLL